MTKFELTLGASHLGGGQTRFRVWAPKRRQVEVVLEGRSGPRTVALTSAAGGYFEGTAEAPPGTRYRYRLDGDATFPDPCARSQPEGPHGPSEVIDPSAFRWTDEGWRGRGREGQVLYELHVGTFSPSGTFAGVQAQLPFLQGLGVTTLELMPVATFPGRWNWGYDGVSLFAPCAVYGTPDDLRRLVDAAHAHGLGVILDVVYNHLGPDGNYLAQYAPGYFTDRYPGEWGQPLDFESEQARPVRDFVIQNAAHWIAEYHLDGLRLDATQGIFDKSEPHVLAELTRTVRAAAPGRELFVVVENEPQDVRQVTPASQGGHGADALWVDDFHHSAKVALTGRPEAYLCDYHGSAQELLSCTLRNGLYQGQWYSWQKKPRGSPLLRAAPAQAVFFLQNHDQIANGLHGDRLHLLAGEPRLRALTTFFLLLPQTPMLFMGQEHFAAEPFLYFVDMPEPLQTAVRKGRSGYLSQVESARHAIEQEGVVVPIGEEAFRRSTLSPEARAKRPGAITLHTELLRLRREDPTFQAETAIAAQGSRGTLAGAVLAGEALLLRWSGDGPGGDRLLILNLGSALRLEPCPEPLLAPPPGERWRPLLCSEEVRFGGVGAVFPTGEGPWEIPGQTTVVLRAEVAAPEEDPA